MSNSFDQELEDRLTRYIAIDSQSDEASISSPSTAIQLDILHLLEMELAEIGAQDVQLTDYGVVPATFPGTAHAPTVGFLAHVDTAPQFSAAGVKRRVGALVATPTPWWRRSRSVPPSIPAPMRC